MRLLLIHIILLFFVGVHAFTQSKYIYWDFPKTNYVTDKPEFELQACIRPFWVTKVSSLSLYDKAGKLLNKYDPDYYLLDKKSSDNKKCRWYFKEVVKLTPGDNVFLLEGHYKTLNPLFEKTAYLHIIYEPIVDNNNPTSGIIALPPLSITWEQPATTTANTDKATYSIKACISESKAAISEIAVLLNGTRVNIPERGIKAVKSESGCANQFEYILTLNPGENRIQINITSATGTISSEIRTIYYQKAETVQSNVQNAISGNRLALIIGNSAYLNGGALRNPVNDATDIAAALQNMGFEVLLHTDLNLRQMDKALEDFGKKLKNYRVGLFYYAGHGVQVGGENYLVPIDAKLTSEGETRYECVPSGILLAKMEEAATTNIIIMDACRNNPFARSWSRSAGGTGLAAINAPKGTFIGFATSPGNTAADGSGRNGIFTNAFLQNIKTPGITIDQLFNRINRVVDGLTNGAQIPWKSSSLQDDFYFNR
ncbi:MAG: caspase family protein [Saprospiraceae bacterium]